MGKEGKMQAFEKPESYKHRSAKIKEEYPRAYKTWTVKEEKNLLIEFKERKSIPELAGIHQRTPSAVYSKLKELGVIEFPFSDNALQEKGLIAQSYPLKKWEGEEEQKLLLEFRAGKSVPELAQLFQRHPQNIYRKLAILGAITPPYKESEEEKIIENAVKELRKKEGVAKKITGEIRNFRRPRPEHYREARKSLLMDAFEELKNTSTSSKKCIPKLFDVLVLIQRDLWYQGVQLDKLTKDLETLNEKLKTREGEKGEAGK